MQQIIIILQIQRFMFANNNKTQEGESLSTFLIQKVQKRQDNINNFQKPKTYHNVPLLVLQVIIICFSTFYYGYCLTYFSTFQPQTTLFIFGDLSVTTVFNAILLGIVPVGAIIGAGIAPILMKLYTRKQFLLVINAIALLIQGIIQIPNVFVFLICRIFQGICIGNYLAIVPIYINELAPNQIKGSFGVFVQIFSVFGILTSYGIGLAMQDNNVSHQLFYRIMTSVNGIFVLIQTFSLYYNLIPQSPNSLIISNKIQQARKVLSLFTLPQFLEKAYQQKKRETAVQRGQIIFESNANIKYHFTAYILAFQLPFMQQMTGINAIVTSARKIVQKALPQLAPKVPLIMNGFRAFSTIIAVFVLIRIGRKHLIYFGNVSLAIIDIIISILFMVSEKDKSVGTSIIILLALYMLIYGISVGPVVWLYVPEIIPAQRVPLATMMNWFGASICIICTPIAISANNGNPYPIFLFFGLISVTLFVVNLLLMQETKGLTSSQIALKFFKKHKQ